MTETDPSEKPPYTRLELARKEISKSRGDLPPERQEELYEVAESLSDFMVKLQDDDRVEVPK